MTALRQHRGILLIVLASLVLLCVSRYVAFMWTSPYFLLQVLTAFQNVVCQSLSASVAIAAAFIPPRRFTGLIWATAFGFGVILANWLADIIRLPVPARPHLSHVVDVLSVFVAAQGLRFLLGWRLVNGPTVMSHPSGQFRVADVFEWTTSVGVLLALGQFWGLSAQDAVVVLPFVVENVLMSLPVASVVTSERGLTWLRSGCLFLWALAVRSGVILVTYVASSQPLQPQWIYLAVFVVFVLPRLLTVGIFLGLLHHLGYRWQTPRSSKVLPEPENEPI